MASTGPGDGSTAPRERIKCFLVDYGVPRACNLACRYCRPKSPPVHSGGKGDIDIAIHGLDIISRHVDAVMFKSSGWGEITIVPNYIALFRAARARGFEVLQLITNGVNFPHDDRLQELSEMGHFSMQLSLDGADAAANAHRFWQNPKLFDRVKANLEHAARKRVPLEVNAVITSLSIDHFEDLLRYLLDLRERYAVPMQCLPRPVQLGRADEAFVATPGSIAIDRFEESILARYSRYKDILPPLRYLEGFVAFMRSQTRLWQPFDTATRVVVGEKGNLSLPGTGEVLGNVFTSDPMELFAARAARHCSQGDTAFGVRMTQFEPHSLFLGGEIGWEEMARIPSCDNPVARERLTALRACVRRERSTDTMAAIAVQSSPSGIQ